jgi:hypothetical protein
VEGVVLLRIGMLDIEPPMTLSPRLGDGTEVVCAPDHEPLEITPIPFSILASVIRHQADSRKYPGGRDCLFLACGSSFVAKRGAPPGSKHSTVASPSSPSSLISSGGQAKLLPRDGAYSLDRLPSPSRSKSLIRSLSYPLLPLPSTQVCCTTTCGG